jgi:histidinol-phosphate aminotransferase
MKFRKCLDLLRPYSWQDSSKEIAGRFGLARVIRFDQNTIPKQCAAIELPPVNDYPDASYGDLLAAIAEYAKVGNNQVVAGAGADEIIEDIVKVFIVPADKVVISTPTYPMYKLCTEIAGGNAVEVLRSADFQADIDDIVRVANEQKAKLIFICNPNNPDGSLIGKSDVEKMLKEFNGAVVVDEAYFEFCDKTVADLVQRYQNLIVIRTFSKAFGLAGARVGYAISSEEIIIQMNKVRPPASISSISMYLALEALRNIRIMRETVKTLTNERDRIKKKLAQLGFEVFPSVTNFLLFKAASPEDADRLFQRALERGYVLRNLSRKKGCRNCLRMTVRTAQENDDLLAVLENCPDSIIFDIDGVIVDVSRSYREAIRQTVRAISGKQVTDADISAIKRSPNSNNDWDVTYALIKGESDLKRIDRGLKAYQLAKEKFQELYLGGLRKNERLLIARDVLERLATAGFRMGLATSRPREEALYALKQFIPEFFTETNIIAAEDCDAEKPNPEPLLLTKERLQSRAAVYVGDTINDALAAKAAGMRFVSVTPGLEADFTIKDVNQILEVLA